MLRLLALSLATFILALPAVASAGTTATGGAAVAAATLDAASSGGTPASLGGEGPRSSKAGGAMAPARAQSSDSGNEPLARAAQDPDAPPEPEAQPEPEPAPEGPGQEQPGEPGGEPQEPTGDEPQKPTGDEPAAEEPAEASAGVAPVTDLAGGLPVSGLETLKLLLLGLVLVLVGARLRAVVRRRRWLHSPTATAAPVSRPRDEPAPAALMPSTAMARRRALAGDEGRH